MTDKEIEEAVKSHLKGLSNFTIQKCRLYIAFQDYALALETMYRQGFEDGVKTAENTSPVKDGLFMEKKECH